MNLTFVYAPTSYLDMPTLAIASLQAYLRSQGYENLHVWDANLDFFHFLFDPSYFRRCLVSARSSGQLRPEQLTLAEATVENLEATLNTFHDSQKYYDARSYNLAFRSVLHGLDLLNHFESDLVYQATPSSFAVKFKDRDLDFSAANVLDHVCNGQAYHFDRFMIEQHDRVQACLSSDVLAFSCANPEQILSTLRMAHRFKALGYPGKIIVGGSFITRSRESWKKDPRIFEIVDALAVFEGEETLHEYLRFLEGEQSIEDVPNLVHLKHGSIHSNPTKKIQNIAHLPTPDFTGYALNDYLTPEPVLPIYASRGCYYDICSFCNHHENYFGGYRVRSPKTVLQDMETYRERYGAKTFFFVDEISSPRYQKELSQLTLSNPKGFRWYVHCRVDPTLTTEDFNHLAKGGVTLLHAGVESSSTSVLDRMKKGYRHEDVVAFLRNLSKSPLTAHLNTIRGFPGETPEDYLQTLEDMYEYAKVGDIVHLYEFTLLLGSPLQKESPSFLGSQSPHPGDLIEVVPFDRAGNTLPTPEQRRHIDRLRMILSKKHVFMAHLFPQDANWATHLLYVSWYRDHGQGPLMDQKLKDFRWTELDVFASDEWTRSTFYLDRVHIQEESIVCPSSLQSYPFEPSFLCWLKGHAKQRIVPREVIDENLSEMTLRESLYKLYRMGALRIQEGA